MDFQKNYFIIFCFSDGSAIKRNKNNLPQRRIYMDDALAKTSEPNEPN